MTEKYPVAYLAAQKEQLAGNRQRRLMSQSRPHQGQGKIALLLYGLGPLSQAGIARCLQLSPATVTLTVRRLEKEGCVCRKRDRLTNRTQIVELTEKGEECARAAARAWSDVNADMTLGFTEEDKHTLSCLLRRVRDNLSGTPMDNFDGAAARLFGLEPAAEAR